MTDDDLVLREDCDGVAHLVLNRPRKLNALNQATLAALRAHLDDLTIDTSVGCVVLSGAGRSFCAGHDLADVGGAGDTDRDPNLGPETIDLLDALPKPTIAKLHGHCLTGGLELALACDLLIAAESTQLADTHGQWGLVPLWGMSVRLPERVGRSTAKELMFTSRRVDGRTAAAIGLVDRCVPDDQLNDAVDQLTAEIVENSWGTNRIAKALVHAADGMTRAEALYHERTVPFGRPDDMHERLRRSPRR